MDNCTYRNYNIAFVHLFLCFLAIAAFHCAGQVAPSGGPKDTIPPKIVETYPVTKAIGFHDNVIQLTFDKWMDKSSVNESIFLSPNLGDLDFDWSGKEINIKFTDTLRENTTYVLTLGTDARDLRAGNKLAESYSLAFSTGDHIDSASLSGKIFDEKPEGIMIFAYQLDQRNADTLNPERCKPDYLTQTGKDGKFFLPFLRIGTYRVFAVRDEYKNLLYDPETDEYGVPQAEFQLTPSAAATTSSSPLDQARR